MRKFTALNGILLVEENDPTNYINQLIIKKTTINTHVQVTTTAIEALHFLSYHYKPLQKKQLEELVNQYFPETTK